jgi:hypothetical protein
MPREGEAHDRKRLEQLCRSITRPALSDERVQLNATGLVELKLKTPWRDWTTHLVMRPLEFMQRLAARATEGRPSGSRAAAQGASDQFGAEREAAAASSRSSPEPRRPTQAPRPGHQAALPAAARMALRRMPARWSRIQGQP